MQQNTHRETGQTPVSIVLYDQAEGFLFGGHLFEIELYRRQVQASSPEPAGAATSGRKRPPDHHPKA